jgi:DNA-directed RNA polymerase subunit beta'
MLSSNNILSPAHGKPLSTPSQDMVLGGYYLTYCSKDLSAVTGEDLDPRPRRFASEEEVILALDAKQVALQDPIEYRRGDEVIVTTPGRVIFNEEVARAIVTALPDADLSLTEFVNRTLGKKETNDFVTGLVDVYGAAVISVLLDTIKDLGFHYATQAGITISKNDIVIPGRRTRSSRGTTTASRRSSSSSSAASSPRRSATSRSSTSGRRRPTTSPTRWRRRSTS